MLIYMGAGAHHTKCVGQRTAQTQVIRFDSTSLQPLKLCTALLVYLCFVLLSQEVLLSPSWSRTHRLPASVSQVLYV